MADPNDRQDDIVRFNPALQHEEKSAGTNTRETGRIHSPARDAGGVSSTQFFRPTNAPSGASLPSDLAPLEPKKETARVSSAAMTAHGLTDENNAFVSTHGIIPAEKKTSHLLWWILLGLSALILLIQIWTYLS